METEITNTDDATTTENTTVAEQVKDTEKVFKQADVDRIVKERLDREKASSKKIKEDADNSVKDYEEKLTSYEEIIKSVVEREKSSIQENYKALLEKLPLIDQYNFLIDPKNKVEKVTIPETPKADGKIENDSTKTLKKFL
jgi:hypothetical protein